MLFTCFSMLNKSWNERDSIIWFILFNSIWLNIGSYINRIILHCSNIHIMKILPLIGIFTIIVIPFNAFSSTARDRAIEHDEYKQRQGHIRKYVSSLILEDLRRYKFAKTLDKTMNKVTKLETT